MLTGEFLGCVAQQAFDAGRDEGRGIVEVPDDDDFGDRLDDVVEEGRGPRQGLLSGRRLRDVAGHSHETGRNAARITQVVEFGFDDDLAAAGQPEGEGQTGWTLVKLGAATFEGAPRGWQDLTREEFRELRGIAVGRQVKVAEGLDCGRDIGAVEVEIGSPDHIANVIENQLVGLFQAHATNHRGLFAAMANGRIPGSRLILTDMPSDSGLLSDSLPLSLYMVWMAVSNALWRASCRLIKDNYSILFYFT
ncbi:MAG: hypothetical protein BWY87_00405 [Deltaproteobacteria bacterium ADurb.Bin510]|nr:MAG: hypothetical protein BWY87_00405 [Deltaproteobacteria bacterium ADurb.Bin510]